MCTPEELSQAFAKNNILRDKNLDNKLLELKNDLLQDIKKEIKFQIKDIPVHQTSPETLKKINIIDNRYNLQDFKMTNMQQQLAGVLEILKENKQADKENKEENRREHENITRDGKLQHQETMTKLDEMFKTKADQAEIIRIEAAVNTKAEKDSLGSLQKLMYWVLAFAVPSLISFLITIIWFLLSMILDKK
jgi:hypothetical protein